MVPLLRNSVKDEPGQRVRFDSLPYIGRSAGGTRSINIDIKGPVLEDISQVAQRIPEVVEEHLPQFSSPSAASNRSW